MHMINFQFDFVVYVILECCILNCNNYCGRLTHRRSPGIITTYIGGEDSKPRTKPGAVLKQLHELFRGSMMFKGVGQVCNVCAVFSNQVYKSVVKG